MTMATNILVVLKAASDLNDELLRKISGVLSCSGILKKMIEKDRWKILADLGDLELIQQFTASL